MDKKKSRIPWIYLLTIGLSLVAITFVQFRSFFASFLRLKDLQIKYGEEISNNEFSAVTEMESLTYYYSHKIHNLADILELENRDYLILFYSKTYEDNKTIEVINDFVSADLTEGASIYFVNVNEFPDILVPDKQTVISIDVTPTVYLISEGKVIKHIGFDSIEKLIFELSINQEKEY